MHSQYSLFELNNGLKTICWQRNGLVSYIGVAVRAGSRDERADRQGLAHFVEHTIFKGTDKRRSWQISNRMEAVGGELNAYTTKEETMIYTNAPSGYEERALELMADLVKSSRFPKEEIDREREVIIEEIYSYLDSPSESVYDEFEELAYKGSALSHNILGTTESVKEIESMDCREFLDKFYTPGNMVLYCCSPLKPEKVKALAEKYFGDMKYPVSTLSRVAPPEMQHFDVTKDKGNHQANTILGARIFGRDDSRKYALSLLNNYLGGPCMNSRFNYELREKRGYVYTVDSSISLMSDTGLFMVYFGSDSSNVEKCRRLIEREIDKLCQSALSDRNLEKIKRQYCGQLRVSSDNIESRAMALGKSILYFGKINDIETITSQIMEVSQEDFRSVAELIAPANCSMLSLR